MIDALPWDLVFEFDENDMILSLEFDHARSARRDTIQSGRDIVLVDTAGRLHIDEDLMQELTQLK